MLDAGFVGVYFIRSKSNGLVKIGFTTGDPDGRLGVLRRMSPSPLESIGVIRGPMTLENALHSRFAGLRRHGEWFEPDELLEEFLSYGVDPWPSLPVDPNRSRWMPSRVLEIREQVEREAAMRDGGDAPWRTALARRGRPSHLKPRRPE